MSLSGSQPAAAVRPARRKLANALRALAMDAVEAARSGHPGMPMGMADIAEVLWNDFLRFSPLHPEWDNRDRFVLSNGHGSMLLYAVAHLTGYALGIEELKRFRQLGSRAAGHPEYEPSIGIETTTGPLGQGLANAVGMALAERTLAAEFNRPDYAIVDHFTYVFLGDGCLMEGVSHEACSLAGTLGLGKLIAVYDDNGISIDGPTRGWFTDDTPARFRAYGWHVVPDIDGHDPDAVAAAFRAAQASDTQPSLLCCKTIIGFGAPNRQGTAATHGSPLGAHEVAAARKMLGWNSAAFEIPRDVLDAWDARARGAVLHEAWRALFTAYRGAHPELAAEYERRMAAKLPRDWAQHAAQTIRTIAAEAKSTATRQASQRALEAFMPMLPELIGGSADLTGSNNTKLAQSVTVSRETPKGNYVYYGVREFAMAAIMNGLALHRGLIPYGGTFLVFSDYARSALRMAALMRLRSILVLTHDSIGLGEDGPTHQPIEHLAGLRAMPNMDVWRPCDAVETVVAWRSAIERVDGPTSLVLTRQGVPHVDRTGDQVEAIARGGYVLRGTAERPALILLATGSEVALAHAAFERLAGAHELRLVSMPCVERFDAQAEAYRQHVLPRGIPVLAIEAASPDSWWRFAGERGSVIGMRSFGASAPADVLFEHFGFTVDAVVNAARELLEI